MKKRIHVGGNLRDVGKRFLAAVQAVERGRKITPRDNVTFLSWDALNSVMSGKRHEMLVHLRRSPAKSIRALARDLRRDYKRVHDDVTALLSVGLIEKTNGALRADYDEIQTSITLKPAA